MSVIPDSARAVLESDALAHLVTLSPDGSPQVSIVWVGLEGDEIVSGHLREQQKLRNIRRDPRVALSLETGRTNSIGLREYLVVHGRATIQEGGAPELLQRLAHTYIGPDVTFPPMPDPPPGYCLRITRGTGGWDWPLGRGRLGLKPSAGGARDNDEGGWGAKAAVAVDGRRACACLLPGGLRHRVRIGGRLRRLSAGGRAAADHRWSCR